MEQRLRDRRTGWLIGALACAILVLAGIPGSTAALVSRGEPVEPPERFSFIVSAQAIPTGEKRFTRNSLYSVVVEGESVSVTLLASTPGRGLWHPVWSPKAGLLFAEYPRTSNADRKASVRLSAGTDGSSTRLVRGYEPRWGQGRSILFLRGADPSREHEPALWRLRLRRSGKPKGKPERLAREAGEATWCRRQPQPLAFVRGWHVVGMKPSTGRWRILAKGGRKIDNRFPACSHDGKRLAVSRGVYDLSNAIHVIDMRTGKRQQYTRPGKNRVFDQRAVWSADDRYIAYIRFRYPVDDVGTTSIRLIDTETGEDRELWTPELWVTGLSWGP